MFNSKDAKRIISISAAAICMLASFRIAPDSNFTVGAADDVLTAFEITEDMKIGWNLGNTLDATASSGGVLLEHAGLETETAWGQPKATEELIKAIKAKGFNTIRIPTTWFQHLDSDNNIDSQWLARVHEIVDYAYKNDMYVILNVHHENWVNRADLGSAYDVMKPRLLKIWEQIANEFKDYDQHLIFECMNEPRAAGTTHEWWGPTQEEVDCINNLNADFVNLVRSIDSPYKDTRLLMVPGYCASSDKTIISRVVVPDDDFVAVSVHAYSPYGFTMDSSVADHSTFNEGYQLELANILEGIRSTFIEKDIPVVIGEFSASNYDNTDARIEWATQYITTTKEIGIPCVLWDNDARGNIDASERHDYINRKTLEWYEDSVQVVDTMMKVLDDDSIAWGSKKAGVQYDHEDITKGVQVLSEPASLDASVKNGNCTPGLNATWAQLEGGDVAIKFTGDEPILALTNGDWDNWTEIGAYDVDEKNGIAYYSSQTIAKTWSGDTADIAHLFARTNGKTDISAIAIIGGSEVIPDQPEDKTKKYPVDLTNAGRKGTLALTFEGDASKYANGGFGFMGAEEWETIQWEGTTDANGKLVVNIDLSKVYAGVNSGEAQIWWADGELELTGYEIIAEAIQPTTGDEEDILWGDASCDGQVKINDAVLILQSISTPDKYSVNGTDESHITAKGERAANVYENANSGITPMDALEVQKYLLGVVASLDPAGK